MAITLTQLRSFLAVIRSGSVTAAAEELVVTQPSISAAVRALTREIGTPLLERDGRGVTPTAAGRAFAPYATDIIGLLDRGAAAAVEASGVAASPTVIAAPDNTTSPLKIHGPGSNLADGMLLELAANGELILAGGSGNGYRLAELMAATNPSGWAGMLKVKTPSGTTLGHILLYTNP